MTELDENAEHRRRRPDKYPNIEEEYYMWECDDIEHLNSAYGDPEMDMKMFLKFQNMKSR